jgi:RNA recognition motif-containing protein
MNLFVGNLSAETTAEDLIQLFSEFGKVVSARIVRDHQTGESRKFGFVEMADKFAAFDAIDNLDVTYLQGQIISVSQAKGKTSGPRQDDRRRPQGRRHPQPAVRSGEAPPRQQ